MSHFARLQRKPSKPEAGKAGGRPSISTRSPGAPASMRVPPRAAPSGPSALVPRRLSPSPRGQARAKPEDALTQEADRPVDGGSESVLEVSDPSDMLEIEADRIADRVMRMTSASGAALPLTRGAAERVDRACAVCTAQDDLQRTASGTAGEAVAPQIVHDALGMPGRPLDAAARAFMEPRFGRDFADVRIHDDAGAAASARAIHAMAYTRGSDIVFDTGRYAPDTLAGQRLLAHELTHVVQQSGARGVDPARVQRQTKSTKCTDAEVTALNVGMHVYCNKPRSCSMQGDSCATATAKVAAGYGCVDERTKLQQKCFSPGDPGYQDHMEQLAQANAALRNCIAVMTAKCAAEAAAAAALAAAAAAAAAAAKKGLKSAAGKALIYAEVAAAVILLVSGKAEAKISLEGDSPLEALFKAMAQDGVAVPDEMRKMIESDPELKKMLEESAKKGGNLSDVQKEVAQKYAEYVDKHMDEFSKDDLQTIMTSTDQVADKVPANMKVEDIKKGLREKAAQKGDPAQADGKGAGTSAPKPATTDGAARAGDSDRPAPTTGDKGKPAQTTGAPVRPADPQSARLQGLSDENRQRINGAPRPVSKLFRELVAGQKEDVKLDDAAVKKFFAIVPADLTDQQAEALIGRLASSQGKTVEAVLEALRVAVGEVRKDATPGTGGTTTDGEASDQPAPSQEQVVEKLKEMAKKADFSKVPEGRYVIRHLSDKIVNGKISAYFYGKLNGVGVVGSIAGTVPADLDVTKLKVGTTFVITITSHSPFVDKDGNVHKILLGTTVTVGR